MAYLFTLIDLYLKLGTFNPITSFALVGLVALLQNILNLFIFLIFARILMSWIATSGYHPIGAVIEQLTEPLIGPIRRVLPPMAGFDFSPMILLLIIYFISNSLYYWIIPLI
ncbi:MAG: YggT family protein [Enterobacterales bacterium]|nr:YggT family protein [Enterobacterales bacterium]